MNIINLIVQLVGGGLGGLGAGRLLPKLSLGNTGNIIAGIVGGIGGGQVLNSLGLGVASSGGLDIGSILSNIIASGIGGGLLMAIVSFVKTLMAKR